MSGGTSGGTSDGMSDPASIHASAVVIGEMGILIRGASGAGKSSLAAALIEQATSSGRFARLLGDDRIVLTAAHGRLIARPHPAIAGLIERRGLGLVPQKHVSAAQIHLLVDCAEAAPRLPDTGTCVTLMGICLPSLAIGGVENPVSLIFAALEQQK